MIAFRAYKRELLLWRTRSTFPAHPLPSTRITSKSDICTLRAAKEETKIEDGEGDVGRVIEPLSENPLSITEFVKAEVDAVSCNHRPRMLELTSEGVWLVSCTDQSSCRHTSASRDS